MANGLPFGRKTFLLSRRIKLLQKHSKHIEMKKGVEKSCCPNFKPYLLMVKTSILTLCHPK
jgi:hypothetical protein